MRHSNWLLFLCWKLNGEAGETVLWIRDQTKGAMMRSKDIPDKQKSQALALGFGGEEGREDLLHHVGRHALAVVGNCESLWACVNRDMGGVGFDGVAQQIDHQLFHLRAIRRELESLGLHHVPTLWEEVAQVGEKLPGIERGSLRFVHSCQAAVALHEAGERAASTLDDREPFAQFRAFVARLQRLDNRDDGRDGVQYFVGEYSGELSPRLYVALFHQSVDVLQCDDDATAC